MWGVVRKEGEGVGGFKDVGHGKSCCHDKELGSHLTVEEF